MIEQDDAGYFFFYNNDDTFEERRQKYNKNGIIKYVYEMKTKMTKTFIKLMRYW